MKKNLFSSWRIFILFLTSLLILLIFLVLCGHLLSFYLNQKPDKIEQFVANLLGKPLQVQQINMTWSGLNPVFTGKQVVIWNSTKTQPLLHVQQLAVRIDSLKTLLSGGKLHLNHVQGRGAVLTIRQTPDHRLSIDGLNTFSSSATQTTPTTVLSTLLVGLFSEQQVSLEAIELHFYPESGRKWPTMRLDLAIDNRQSSHQLNAQLQFLDAIPSSLYLNAKFEPLTNINWKIADLNAKVYLQGQQVGLDRWFSLWTQDYTLQNARANFKLWANWQQAHFTQMQIQIANQHPSILKIPQANQPLTLSPFFASLRWQIASEQGPSLEGFVKNLSIRSGEAMPGFEGMNAYLQWTPAQGQLIARSKNLTIQAPSYFEMPLHFDQFVSDVSWQRRNNALQIKIPTLLASNKDFKLKAQLGFDVPPERKQSTMRLFADVQTDHAQSVVHYLPAQWIDPQVRHWLSTAILQGSSHAQLLFQGSLNTFPFDQNQGTFLAVIPISNATLRYEAIWPPLEQINGQLTFAQRHMQLHVDSARIKDIPLNNINAYIPELKKNVQAVLTVTTNKIDSRFEQALAFLKASPLSQKFSRVFSELVLKGPLSLHFKLVLPLEKGPQTLKVQGAGTTAQATVQIPARQLQLQQVKGVFTFSEKGFETKNLQALLWNKPLQLSIHSTPTLHINLDYEGLQTQLTPEKDGLRFSVDTDLARGNLFVPDQKGAVWEADFASVQLGALSTPSSSVFHIKQIPPLDIQIDQLRHQARELGHVTLELRPNLQGLGISTLQAGSANYHLEAQGQWYQQQKNYSNFQGQLDSHRLSDFLADCGLPASLTAQQAQITFNLRWPGPPYAFRLPALQGNISFKATNGQLIDIGSSAEAKVSFGRLLNFLSLQSLGRRLQLDFSDLQAKGFDFTDLEGDWILRNGNALTRDFKIEGPVASITMNGRIGLIDQDYNLTINVVPHFTSSLPVLVGLAGGPIAGAVTWIVNSVLGSTVQKIAETSFQMTGKWGDPHIQKNN